MKHYWFNVNDYNAVAKELKSPQHDCKKLNCRELTEFDIVSMQSIDATCNDCRLFKREEFIKEMEVNVHRDSEIRQAKDLQKLCRDENCETFIESQKRIEKAKNIKPTIIKLGKNGYWRGKCLKFKIDVTTKPCNYEGLPCFEHRKQIIVSPESNEQ